MTNRTITSADIANSKRLCALWKAKKAELGLTQTTAAQKLGYKSQSMVSMQIKGEVALNADAILKWAQLLRVNPGDIDPALGALNFTQPTLKKVKVPVIARMSGEAAGSFQCVEIMTQMTRQVYGVSVDVTGYEPFARQGSTLIISQEEEPVTGDEVFIRLTPDKGSLHMLKTYITTDASRGVAVVRDLNGGEPEELALNDIELIDPIVGVDRPVVNRPIRLRPRQVNGL